MRPELEKYQKIDESLEEKITNSQIIEEQYNSILLKLEIAFGLIGCLSSLIIIVAGAIAFKYIPYKEYIGWLLSVSGFIFLLITAAIAIRIEQMAGYYECHCCKHRYVPSYFAVLMAPHLGRTRYMRCPECWQKTWQKKKLKKYNYIE